MEIISLCARGSQSAEFNFICIHSSMWGCRCYVRRWRDSEMLQDTDGIIVLASSLDPQLCPPLSQLANSEVF